MPLEYERNTYVLVGKRILKSNLSKNPSTLLAYKRDIITAHNRFVNYITNRYESVSEDHKAIYRQNLDYVREKTSDCFKKLNVEYQFTDNIFEFIEEAQANFSDKSNLDEGTDSEDTYHFDENLRNSDDDNRENDNGNSNNQDNQNNGNDRIFSEDEMALTVVEFLNFATKIIPDFDGTYANLQSFIDGLNLANASVGTHGASLIELIKSKLKGTARGCISNENTVPLIIAALQTNVKAESASLIESKMMNIIQSKKKANDYVKEIELLASDLKRAHITEGVPIANADKLATNSAVKALRKNASSDKVKWSMETSTFQNLNEAVDKFVSLNTAEAANDSGHATINYMNKRHNSNYRGRYPNNRGYQKNNYRSYNRNYRSSNYRGSNNRGYNRGYGNRRGNNSYHNNGRSNPVRYAEVERNETESGNYSGPQQTLLRDA